MKDIPSPNGATLERAKSTGEMLKWLVEGAAVGRCECKLRGKDEKRDGVCGEHKERIEVIK